MPRKKFVAVKTRFYKTANAKGELGHVNRVFATNKNVLPGEHHPNFGDDDLEDKFLTKLSRAESHRGSVFRKDSNTYIDQVLVFSSDQVEWLIEKYGYDKFSGAMTNLFKTYQKKLKAEQGFEPIGFNFHADEGHVCPDTGKIKYNYHAHVVFMNYDFKTKKQPLARLKRKDFSRQQDFAHEIFAKAGFKRGNAKSETHAKGLEKDKFVAEKRKAELERTEKLKRENDVLKADIADLTLSKDIAEAQAEEAVEMAKTAKKTLSEAIKAKDEVIEAKDEAIEEAQTKLNRLKTEYDKLLATFEEVVDKVVERAVPLLQSIHRYLSNTLMYGTGPDIGEAEAIAEKYHAIPKRVKEAIDKSDALPSAYKAESDITGNDSELEKAVRRRRPKP